MIEFSDCDEIFDKSEKAAESSKVSKVKNIIDHS